MGCSYLLKTVATVVCGMGFKKFLMYKEGQGQLSSGRELPKHENYDEEGEFFQLLYAVEFPVIVTEKIFVSQAFQSKAYMSNRWI